MLTELLLPVLLVCLTLVLGPYLLAVIDGAIAAAVGRRATGSLWLAPLHRGAWLWLQPRNHTERPDSLNWQLAPAAYLALAAAGLAVVPWSATLIPTDISTGLVGQRTVTADWRLSLCGAGPVLHSYQHVRADWRGAAG